MRIVFMGTPDFSVSALESLLAAGHEVVGVVTQPDKPRGRSGALAPTPVKARAEEAKIPVVTPKKVRKNEEFMDWLRAMAPDVIVVVAFGQILDEPILTLPPYGCVNIHASLLPKYRGAAPIQWAVINGDSVSGVTTMKMDKGLDTGDILETVIVPIEKEETGGSLFDKLAVAGGQLIVTTLKGMENGTITPRPQGEDCTYVGVISKEEGHIDFSAPAVAIERRIRGLNPWPSAYCSLGGKTLKIWRAEVLPAESGDESIADGTVVESGKHLVIKCGEGRLSILELQLEGKKRMETAPFLRGYSVETGTVLNS